MTEVVLDSSAVLAFLAREPGAAVVGERLATAKVSSVNLCEIIGKLADRGFKDDDIRVVLDGLRLRVVDFDREHAWTAGVLKRASNVLGLSLGDRACLALAADIGAEVFTADRSWADLDAAIEIRLIR